MSVQAPARATLQIYDVIGADPFFGGVDVSEAVAMIDELDANTELTIRINSPGGAAWDGLTLANAIIRHPGATATHVDGLAASGKTTCFGTVVLMNDQFFAARDVTKTDGYSMSTFGSRHYGALGVVNEDHIRALRASARVMQCGTDAWKTPFDLSKTTADKIAAVDIVYGTVDASGASIAGPVGAGIKGIVAAGHGPGGLSKQQGAAQKEAMDRAKRTLAEATADVVKANAGYRAVSATPHLDNGRPVAEVTLVHGDDWKVVNEPLD